MVLNFIRIFNNNIFLKYYHYYFIVKIVLSLLKFIYLFLFLKNLGSHAVSYDCVHGPRAFSQVEKITVLWRVWPVLAGFGRGAVCCGTVMQEQDLRREILVKYFYSIESACREKTADCSDKKIQVDPEKEKKENGEH